MSLFLPVSLPVKEVWKSVNIWGSYGQEFSVLFFWDTVYKQHSSGEVKLASFRPLTKRRSHWPNRKTAEWPTVCLQCCSLTMLAQSAEQGLWNCRASVRMSVCLSVRLCHPSPRCAADLLRAGDIDLLLHSRRPAAANTSSVSRDQLTQQAEQRRCLTVCPATAMVVKQIDVATEHICSRHFWHPSACQQWSFMSSSSQFSYAANEYNSIWCTNIDKSLLSFMKSGTVMQNMPQRHGR